MGLSTACRLVRSSLAGKLVHVRLQCHFIVHYARPSTHPLELNPGAPTFVDMTEDEQDWLAELGFSEEDEVWPPRRGPTAKELKSVFDKYTPTGMNGDTLQPAALQDLWRSGALSVWCDELEVIPQETKPNFVRLNLVKA